MSQLANDQNRSAADIFLQGHQRLIAAAGIVRIGKSHTHWALCDRLASSQVLANQALASRAFANQACGDHALANQGPPEASDQPDGHSSRQPERQIRRILEECGTYEAENLGRSLRMQGLKFSASQPRR